MKYSKFTQNIKGLGYRTVDKGDSLYIATVGDSRLIAIDKTKVCSVDSTYGLFDSTLPNGDKEKLLTLAVELAITPLKDREDEKRYRLRLPFAIESDSYLNVCDEGFFVSSKDGTFGDKTVFTESEVSELKQNHNLDSFVMEEVKEDE